MRWRIQQGRGLFSGAIGWFGGGGYSHIDVFTTDGQLRGARADELAGVKSGYRDRPANYDDAHISRYTMFTLNVSPTQERRYWDFSNAQLGKPYDKRGIAGFAFGKRDWRDESAWYCSEEVQANCEYAGIFSPLPPELWRVDPGDNAFEFCQKGAAWETTQL